MTNIAISADIGELAKALCAAQAAMRPAARQTENAHFKRNYADLASYWEAARGAMTANGLALTQLPEFDGKLVSVRSVLLHTSGQWIASTFSIQPERLTPQGVGSAVSYARRYAMAGILGMASVDDDDDGEAATERDARPRLPANPEADSKRLEEVKRMLEQADDLEATKEAWTSLSTEDRMMIVSRAADWFAALKNARTEEAGRADSQ